MGGGTVDTGNDLGLLPIIVGFIAFPEQVPQWYFHPHETSPRALTCSLSLCWVLSHLSTELMMYLKEKRPNRQDFFNILSTTLSQGKGCILGLFLLGSPCFVVGFFYKTMPRACFQFSFSSHLLVRSKPVRCYLCSRAGCWVFYLVYVCTSY